MLCLFIGWCFCQFVCTCGRCCCHIFFVADVIANDVSYCGRCYCYHYCWLMLLVLWKRFVDDTFTILKKQHKNSFLEHLNSINPSIKFTSEETRTDGSMPFLDILITCKDDGSLQTSVYRKLTHTNLYLQWDSHHIIPSKYSVVGIYIIFYILSYVMTKIKIHTDW